MIFRRGISDGKHYETSVPFGKEMIDDGLIRNDEKGLKAKKMGCIS